MTDTSFDLTQLIHPIDPELFKRTYWEKQPLLIRREDEDYYRDLLSLTDVDQVLSTSSIRASLIRVLHDGRDIAPEELVKPGLYGHVGVLEALYREYRNGATIVLQFLHERWKPLLRMCQSLATEFSAAFQVNAYLTPAKSQGLDTHYDTHDVFVLQTEGSKHWRLYEEPPIRLPLAGQPYDKRSMQPGKLLDEFDLHAGDLIYIPRGFVHDAASNNTVSLHLTLGIEPITWGVVLLKAVDEMIEQDSCFRESLPLGLANNGDLRKHAEIRLTELLDVMRKKMDPAVLIEDAANAALLGKQPSLERHLLDLEATSGINLQTRLRRRPELQWRMTATEDFLCLHFHGKTVQIPAHAEAGLQYITKVNEFSAASIPGALDDAGKLVLVESLLREGFLTIPRP